MSDYENHTTDPPVTESGADPQPSGASSDSEGRGPRERLLGSIRRPGRGQIVTAVLLMLLGFAAVTQVQARNRDDTYAGARQSDLVSLINSLSLATDRTEREITRLTRTRDSLRNDSDARRTAVDLAQQEAQRLALIAGTVPAIGPGIRITIQDPRDVLGTAVFLNGVSELRDAGAEAIDINGVRIVAQTSIAEGADGGLILGDTPVTTPYVIEVIGDPATLRSAVTFEGGLAFEVRSAGARLSVNQADSVEIASVAELTTPRYAVPASGE